MSGYDLGTARGRVEIDASSLGRTTAGLDKMSRGLLVTGAVGAAAFVGVVKSAADFEKIISAVGAVSGATDKQIGQLRDTALDLGTTTAYSATEVAGAMEDLAKAGISIEDITGGAAEAVTTLAAAAGDELPGGVTQGAEIIANAMKTFEASADDLEHFADVLVGAAASSTINIEDMATTLKYAGPIAHELGIDIDDLSATIAILGDRGIKGSTAGTSLRGVLLSLSPTSKKATATMKELGFITKNNTNLFFDQNGALKPLPEVMQLLQDKTKGMSKQAKIAAFNTIFQRRAMNSALILADQGAAGFDKYTKSIKKVSAADIAKKKLDNLAGAVKILKSSFNRLLIEAGTPFLAMITRWTKQLTKFVNFLAKLNPKTLELVVKIVAIASAIAIVLGAGLAFLAMMLKMYRAFKDVQAAIILFSNILKVSFLTNPIFLIIAAIVALGVAFYVAYQKSESFRKFVDGIIDTLQELVKPLQPIVDRLKLVGHYLVIMAKMFLNGEQTAKKFGNIVGTITRLLTGNRNASLFMTKAGTKLYMVFRRLWEAADRLQARIDFGKVARYLGYALLFVLAPVIGLAVGFMRLYKSNETFRKGVQSVIDWLKTNFLPVFHDIGELFKALIPIVVSVGKALVPIVQAWIRLLVTIFQWFFGIVKNAWNLFGDNIIQIVKIAFNFIKSQISAAMRIVRGVIQVVTGLIKGDWGMVWGGIQKIFSGIWAGILSILKAALGLIIVAIQTVFDALNLIWDAGWSFIKNVVPATFNYILQIIKKVMSAIYQVIAHVVKMILAPFVWLYDQLVGHSVIPDMMDAMRDIIKRGLDAILRFFRETPGKIVGYMATLAVKLVVKGKEALDGLLRGARDGFTSVYNWFTMLPGKIIGGLGSVGSLLLQAGKDIMQGLLDGLKSMLGKVTGFLDSVTDKFPIHKGPPARDKKLLKNSGRLIMQGLVKGLEKEFPSVEAALRDVTGMFNDRSVGVEASLVGSAGGRSAGLTVNVNMEFPVTEAGQEDKIEKIIEDKKFLPTLIRGIRSGVGKKKR